MSAHAYFEAALRVLRELSEKAPDSICQAAGLMVDAIVSDHSLFSFGASHSFMLTEEMVYRTGGLMLVNPIYPHGMNTLVRPMTLTSQLERLVGLGAVLLKNAPIKGGDVLMIASVSGRNAVAIDMAIAAREMNVTVIGITSMAYTTAVKSRHPSGKKLVDLCDVVIDNGAPYGDAAAQIEGLTQKVSPLSSLTGIAIVNALVAEVVSQLVARGIVPPVFISANVDGGDAFNARQLNANKHRIHYLD